MNNEPVAWMNKLGRLEYEQGNGFEIPLYTHPAKESKAKDRFSNYESICLQCGTTIYKPAFKTLTDEEIMECWEERDQYANSDYRFNFARAILRKAQEK